MYFNSTMKRAEFTRTEHALIPSRVHDDDIGYDLTLIEVASRVNSNTTIYDTGIAVKPPQGYYFEVHPRSSISKTGYILSNSTGIIDPNYRGTIKVALTKVNSMVGDLELPARIVQLILRQVEPVTFVEVDQLDNTSRGSGGFGSTN